LFATVLLWGSTFAGLSLASRSIAPVWIIAGRMGIATVLLAIPAAVELRLQARKPSHRYVKITWRAVGLMALVGVAFTALPYLAYASAARTTPSSILAICNGAAPIFTMMLAHFLLPGERMTVRRAAGVAMGFIGLVVLTLPKLEAGMDPSAIAMILAIGAAALYAGGNIVTRQAPRIPPIASSFILVSTGAVASIIAALASAPFPQDVSAESFWALVAIGAGPTGIAMISYIVLVQRAGPVFTSLGTYIAPLVALAIGLLFLNERPHVEAFAALALILSGVWIANSRPSRKPAAA
jgi:drug/metabolite transporter (DMT)-like permease